MEGGGGEGLDQVEEHGQPGLQISRPEAVDPVALHTGGLVVVRGDGVKMPAEDDLGFAGERRETKRDLVARAHDIAAPTPPELRLDPIRQAVFLVTH